MMGIWYQVDLDFSQYFHTFLSCLSHFSQSFFTFLSPVSHSFLAFSRIFSHFSQVFSHFLTFISCCVPFISAVLSLISLLVHFLSQFSDELHLCSQITSNLPLLVTFGSIFDRLFPILTDCLRLRGRFSPLILAWLLE